MKEKIGEMLTTVRPADYAGVKRAQDLSTPCQLTEPFCVRRLHGFSTGFSSGAWAKEDSPYLMLDILSV